VVDDKFGLLGIVTHDDVLDVVTREATEDLQRQAALGPIEGDYLHASFYQVWKSRVKWLSVLFVAELGTFTAMAYFEDAISAIVVLALFVPLCLSTGGNSGTQAATLVTRAMALGFVTPKDWRRVLKRELMMGLALGGALGVIAFARGALTPSDTRSGPEKVKNPFTVVVPAGTELIPDERHDVPLVVGTPQTVKLEKNTRVRLPEGIEQLDAPTKLSQGWEYEFPPECEVRTEPVRRWELGLVISIAVLFICLWGTLMGCVIPLVIRTFGGDPAMASGAMVATFVDVSGIIIFFSVAKMVLL
jgi:magnesium transporter